MSELTPCNFCNMADIRRRAAKQGLKLTVLPSPADAEYAMDPPGFDVFLHPPHITNEQLIADCPDEGKGEYWVAWMWSISDHCVC